MDICLSHISAFRWLMRNPNPLVAQKRARYRADAPDAIPSPTRCRELALELDPERVFLDFLSSSRRGRNNDEHFAVHVQTEPLPPKSFIRIGAIGRTAIYVASPELVFMQLAQRRPLEEAVYFGFALCSLSASTQRHWEDYGNETSTCHLTRSALSQISPSQPLSASRTSLTPPRETSVARRLARH